MRSSRSFRVLAFRRSTVLYPLTCGALLAGGLLTQVARADDSTSAVRAARLLLAQLPAAQSDAQNGPVVTVLQPGYADVLRGETAIIVGIQARRYPASSIELLVDGKSASNGAMKIGEGTSLNFKWRTSDFADGPHRLTVRVTDTQGFRSDAEVRIYINNGKAADVTPPTLSWMNIRSGDILRGEKKMQLEAADNFGVKYVWISVKSTLNPSKPLKMWMVNRAPYAFTLNSDNLPDGLYTLEALAWDALENEGKAEKVTFGIANNTINPTWMSDLDKARASSKAPVAFNAPVQSDAPRPRAATTTNRLVVPSAKNAANPRIAERMERPDNLGAVSEEAAMTGVFAELDSAPAKAKTSSRTASQKRALIAAMPSDARRQANAPLADAAKSSQGARLSVVETRGGTATSSRDKAASTRGIARSVATLPRDENRIAMIPSAPAEAKSNPANVTVADGWTVPKVARPTTNTSRNLGPVRIGELDFSAARNEPAPVNAVAATAVEAGAATQIAGSAPVKAPNADIGVARPSLPRVAAIPDFVQPQRSNARTASITIAPMGKTIPAWHNARAGETLDAVAARYGVSRELLSAVNPEARARVLAAGTKLRLPRLLQVRYAGKPVVGDVASMMVGSTGVTPFRFLFEQQGGTMTWNAAKQSIVARTSTQEVTITIGSKAAVVNRQKVMMDLAAFLLSGRAMVPVRFFEKALHAQIEWEPQTGRFFVAMNGDANVQNAPAKRG